MEKFSTELLAEMHNGLQTIAMNALHPLQNAERSYYLLENIMHRLKAFFNGYSFKDETEEIRFFKEIKPAFLSEQIYFEQVYSLEVSRPVGPAAAIRKYYKRAMNRINAFFDKHRQFHTYYRSGLSNLDSQYFVRHHAITYLMPFSMADFDSSFSTPYSYILARLLAYEQLRDYVYARLKGKPAETGNSPESGNEKGTGITFTGPKAAAEEVILAWNAKGYFNHGNSSLKEQKEAFEQAFNLRLGNIYRAFIGMTIRKKGYTPHLDGMKEALENQIKEKHA